MSYFKCIESPLDLSKYTVSVTDELCKINGFIPGSYRVFPSRVLGLSYDNYITYVLQKYKENVYFPSYTSGPVFENKKDAENLANFLDVRFCQILKRWKDERQS